ncbi:cytochrome b5 [Dacryopinax primogenitus]|uniref:Cytochrome b5 n=1 Tax=Dacryopinax primogenitus (strain DJM 731) TaxID=1858805 RepID=M5GCQ8_DACPD|nr:cytochrome b5 [Dacryopinax primogenitus]EJU06365.1 cytochrome b5 [Dacryopinax primogenitus]
MADMKTITAEEFKQHNSKDSLWVLLHGKVYDVTKFLDEHPGGDEVILAEKGTDATEAFEDVGHSDEARALLPDMQIGVFSGDMKAGASAAATEAMAAGHHVNKPPQTSVISYLLPLAFLGAYLAYRFYLSQQ